GSAGLRSLAYSVVSASPGIRGRSRKSARPSVPDNWRNRQRSMETPLQQVLRKRAGRSVLRRIPRVPHKRRVVRGCERAAPALGGHLLAALVRREEKCARCPETHEGSTRLRRASPPVNG